MSNTNSSGPSGRSPFPAARNPRFRAPRSSIDSSWDTNNQQTATATNFGGDSGAHSPFLNNLLRFSPKNTNLHLSPLNSQRNSVTNAGQRRTRFFEPSSSKQAPTHNNDNIENDSMTDNNTFNSKIQSKQKNSNNNDEELVDGIPLNHLRNLVEHSMITSPKSASYYAGILYAKTGKCNDALLLAQAHVAAGQYEACLRILEEAALLITSSSPWEAALVAAQALTCKQDWSALTDLLEDLCRLPDSAGTSFASSLTASGPILEDGDDIGWLSLKRSIPLSKNHHSIHPLALLCWYRGQAYHETGCGIRALTYWKLALKLDCQCQQAWESLLEKNLLTSSEAYQLVAHDVEFSEQQAWLRALYLARIEITPQEPVDGSDDEHKKSPALLSSSIQGTSLFDASSIHLTSPVPGFQTPPGMMSTTLNATMNPGTSMSSKDIETMQTNEENNDDDDLVKDQPPQIQKDIDNAFDEIWDTYKLDGSPQVLAIAARRSYRRYDWKTSLKFCQLLAQLDPLVEEAAFCYVATLVILGHKRVLFRLAHEWVEASPKSAQSWFAVGSYYYCIQRYHVAQRHFCRATRLNPQCTEAWIAFGCAFAACDESDQALASFRAAQRLSPGEHTSLMYMGMEYIRTNHLVLANYFLQAALSASGGDPLCLHELGVLAANKNEHKEAIHWFRRALASATGTNLELECIELCQDPYWEPTIFNLGHSYRKSRKFDHAVTCFRRCIALCPDTFSTYAALAFTKHLMGELENAVSLYHQALSLKPDDPFSTDMLNRALTDQLMSGSQDIFQLPKQETVAAKSTPLFSPANSSIWSKKDDSMFSEGQSDVDMSETS